MTKLLPWSPSSLDTFINCPRQFHETRVLKRFRSEQGPEQIWGERVHKHFEQRQAHRVPLPDELKDHEDFMAKLEAKPGFFFCEQKVALDRKLAPCGFFDKECFFRGVIDYLKTNEDDSSALIVDYKTGKPFDKWKQQAAYALHTFTNFPFVNIVNAQFYWTQTKSVTKKVWGRNEIKDLWAMFIPDLKQYKEAFQTDTWQPRQSGLCAGWCPVTSCEFYRARRPR